MKEYGRTYTSLDYRPKPLSDLVKDIIRRIIREWADKPKKPRPVKIIRPRGS